MPSKNPAVNKKARDKWYRLNKGKQLKRQKERRKELKLWFWEYKQTLSCSDCGMSFNNYPECCDFHHLDPKQKEGQMAVKILSSKSALIKEINKCIPLCANCHRKKHRDVYVFYK